MEIFHAKQDIDFLGKRFWGWGVSAFLIFASIVSLAVQGLHLGLDFTGGTKMEFVFSQSVELDAVRKALQDAELEGAVVQHMGSTSEIQIRVPLVEGVDSKVVTGQVTEAVSKMAGATLTPRSIDFIGPQVGEELATQGLYALLAALGGIVLYLAMRFEWRMAVGAIIATLHDVVITLGFFSVTRMDFDLTVLAAMMAIIGYSVNDTVVVFDRIRENFRKLRMMTPAEVMNRSITETLGRTIMTSGMTQLVVVALLIYGGPVLLGFSTAFFIGIVIGTYSSVFIASGYALLLGVNRESLMPPEKEGADMTEGPVA
jgi:preprotein translocase subunit SecF